MFDMNNLITLSNRFKGALLGLACGDAVGTTVEFMPRGSFAPLTDMVGGGPFRLQPGQWTDDTSMALCLAESLIAKGGFDALDQMTRYLNWYKHGYWSATGECFDIGITTRRALDQFELSGHPFAGSTDRQTAGNGALMRLVPVVIAFHRNRDQALQAAIDSSRTTHAAPEALECSLLFAHVLLNAFNAERDVLKGGDRLDLNEPRVKEIAKGQFYKHSRHDIAGTGYCVASLEAALWCFHHTQSFEAAVLMAANLGDDADTTAAITGQVAGAFYGVEGIPPSWLAKLHARGNIEQMAVSLADCTG
jgi:ADP-ribosyl-[dinitrogen reductase] hydrolase